MPTTVNSHVAACLALTRAIGSTRTVEEIYATALDALADGLGVSRSSILLFDPDGVMRFKAFRGLSEAYRTAVEGHTPWRPDTPDPEPIVVPDVTLEPSLAPHLSIIRDEGIAAMAFIPLVSLGGVIGKFMLYSGVPHTPSPEEIQLATLIASQVAFAVERTREKEQARRSEERLRFALDAASMGTWDWDLAPQTVRGSDNLARIHGLPAGTFASYEREIHPDDRARVLASARRAIAEGVPYDVEYRIVAPDGSIRWVEGKGRVEYEDGRPVRMSGVCMIVTRRKLAELSRLEAAEEASRLKDEFLATLSHELRTPMNAILGWVQMLQAGNLSEQGVRQAIDVVGRNARLQAQLIEDILDVSRIITGKLDIERKPVFLPSLIETVIAGVLPAAEAKRIAIASQVAPNLPPVDGDPKRLHQVVANVVANAVKFTPEDGQVEICCAAAGSWIEIEVRDSGAGIPLDFLPFVFDRFRQADSRSTRQHGGLGLGLSIARHLIEQHAGEIRAYSRGPGLGTMVVIRLPSGTYALDGTAPARVPAPEEDVRLDGSTIVVVDDQADSRELLAALFQGCGAAVVQCSSARSALEALAAAPVHLLVADIAMPQVDGYELIRRVRELPGAMPALAVSAYARPEDRGQAIAAGYDAYCAKPVEPAVLLRMVRELLGEPWRARAG